MIGIVVDSCCDITKDIEEKYDVGIVPFKIAIDGVEYVDDDNLDREEFLIKLHETRSKVPTSCPSPLEFKEAILAKEEKDIFVITISSKLSGSYNAAMVAKQMIEDEGHDKRIYVLDSLSAAAGEIVLFFKLVDLMNKLSFEKLIEEMERLKNEMKTFFILDRFDNLVKNGRMARVTGIFAGALNIKPIMYGANGEIETFQINRGFKKSLSNLSKALGDGSKSLEGKLVVAVGIHAEEKGQFFKEKLEELYNFKNFKYFEGKALSTTYANEGGIVIAMV